MDALTIGGGAAPARVVRNDHKCLTRRSARAFGTALYSVMIAGAAVTWLGAMVGSEALIAGGVIAGFPAALALNSKGKGGER